MTLEQKSVYRIPQLTGRILVFLDSCPQKKTRLMYGCNLSWAQLKDYQNKLTEQGLITIKDGLWSLTAKGHTAAKLYQDYMEACA